MKKQSINSKIQISEKWDKLDVFTRKKRENSKKTETLSKMSIVTLFLKSKYIYFFTGPIKNS